MEVTSSELSRRLSPLALMAARSLFSRSMLPVVVGLGGAKKLGRKLWKAVTEGVEHRATNAVSDNERYFTMLRAGFNENVKTEMVLKELR